VTLGKGATTDAVLDGVDLDGTWTLVTGASSGLGQETARAIAAHGGNVIMAVRDVPKGERAANSVRAGAAAGVTVELREVDLTSFASVRKCSDAIVNEHDRVDVIIANAGVMATPERRTADGFELQFGTNHLGHFLLVNRLRPVLASPGRIVNLSSGGHRFSPLEINDVNFERTPYNPWVAYGRSKTANILFSVELDRRGAGNRQRAVAVHPGMIHTELGRYMTEDAMEQLTDAFAAGESMPEWKTIPQGAATSVWCAFVAEPNEVGGRYCEDCHVAAVTSDTSRQGGVAAYAIDPEIAAALWARSEELVGESFPS
jgi:NAD(P)-dependent dehydrogenase (short-subunit alcohol dehydrogenase family)